MRLSSIPAVPSTSAILASRRAVSATFAWALLLYFRDERIYRGELLRHVVPELRLAQTHRVKILKRKLRYLDALGYRLGVDVALLDREHIRADAQAVTSSGSEYSSAMCLIAST